MSSSRRFLIDHTALFGCLQDSKFRELLAGTVASETLQESVDRAMLVSRSSVSVSCQSGCTLRSVMQPIADSLGQNWSREEWDGSHIRQYFESHLPYHPDPLVLYYRDRTGTTRYLTF